MNSYANYEVCDTSVSSQQSLRIHLCGHLWQAGRLKQYLFPFDGALGDSKGQLHDIRPQHGYL